jgi:hypothetical protein
VKNQSGGGAGAPLKRVSLDEQQDGSALLVVSV